MLEIDILNFDDDSDDDYCEQCKYLDNCNEENFSYCYYEEEGLHE